MKNSGVAPFLAVFLVVVLISVDQAQASSCLAQVRTALSDQDAFSSSQARLSRVTEDLIVSAGRLKQAKRYESWVGGVPFIGRRQAYRKMVESDGLARCRSAWEACVVSHQSIVADRLRGILALEAAAQSMTELQRHADAAAFETKAASARYELETHLDSMRSMGSSINQLLTSFSHSNRFSRVSRELTALAIPHPNIQMLLENLSRQTSAIQKWTYANQIVTEVQWITTSEAVAILNSLPSKLDGFVSTIGRNVRLELEPYVRRGRVDPNAYLQRGNEPIDGMAPSALNILLAIELNDLPDPRQALKTAYLKAVGHAEGRHPELDNLNLHLIHMTQRLPSIKH